MLTGVLLRVADGFEIEGRDAPDLVDAVLVGALAMVGGAALAV